jgi:hypothetical protein
MPTLGTCPVCERSIRVRTGKMVHHGYQRPGSGRIVGDCFAVGRPPYEVSCEGTEKYRHVIREKLLFCSGYLAKLRAGAIHSLGYDERVPVPSTAERTRRHDPGWTYRRTVVTDAEEGPQLRIRWQVTLGKMLADTEGEVRRLTGEVERCDRLIREWAPGELHDVEAEPAPGPRRRPRRLFWRGR